MSGYDELNKAWQTERAQLANEIPPEAFEQPLSPVPVPGRGADPTADLGLMLADFLNLEGPPDMTTPSGADQLALHTYMMTLVLKEIMDQMAEALERLSALEAGPRRPRPRP
jgi:hypothetical protein